MIKVISNIGQSVTAFSAITVVRPVLVSLGFATIIPLGAYFIVQPLTLWLNARRQQNPVGRIHMILRWGQTPFLIHTAVLLVLVTASSYAGTSNLFAAYLSGVSISWWDSEVPHPQIKNAISREKTFSNLSPSINLNARVIDNDVLREVTNHSEGTYLPSENP